MGMNAGIAAPAARRRYRRKPAMSEINVTPMVDVMLVLLIIFMVSAPLLTVGVPIDLPQTQAKSFDADKEPLTISVNVKGQVFLQESEIVLDDLVAKLRAVTDARGGLDERVYVRGDRQGPAGTRTALNLDTPKPFVEKISDPKPTEDPNAKVATRDVKAAAETPPAPAPKPPAPAESKPEPKRDLIAEAIKKDDAKKPEPKRAEPKVPTPPKKATTAPQPMFDPRQLQALLDKRDPQRLAATGDAIHTGVSLGAPSTIGAQLSQSELDALRARLGQLWNPPAGASNPDELVVLVRIQLGPDGKLTAPPMVLTRGNS